jgi:ABC-2 type transport system permease protein
MSMLIIGRHTRAEEESGRDELIRSGAVGRLAPLSAAVVVALAANAVLGALVAVSLIAYGLPVTGSLALGGRADHDGAGCSPAWRQWPPS